MSDTKKDPKLVGLLGKYASETIVVTGPAGPVNIGKGGSVNLKSGRATKEGPKKNKDVAGATQKEALEIFKRGVRCLVGGETKKELESKGAVFIYPDELPTKKSSSKDSTSTSTGGAS